MKSIIQAIALFTAASVVVAAPAQQKRAARSVTVNIVNSWTRGTWSRMDLEITSGEATTNIPSALCMPQWVNNQIQPCTDSFTIESDGIMTGAEGTIGFQNDNTGAQVWFQFYVPFWGDNEYIIQSAGDNMAYTGSIEKDKNASATFTLAWADDDDDDD